MEQCNKRQQLSVKLMWRILFNEYVRWICNSKWVVILILLVMIRELVIEPMLAAADDIGQIINILEPAVAIGNSGLILFLLPLFYIILISDCPLISPNLYYMLPRAGRLNWVVGQIIFQVAAICTYLIVLITSSFIQVFSKSFFVNGWSLVTTKYDYLRGDKNPVVSMQSLIPRQLYNQMPPIRAFVLTFSLLFLYLLLWSEIMLLATLYARKKIALWAEIGVMAIGMALVALKSKMMWLFPSGQTILWMHYQTYFRKYVFPTGVSYLIFIVCLLVINILIIRRANDVPMDILWEEKIA